jgi:hypothetical protein
MIFSQKARVFLTPVVFSTIFFYLNTLQAQVQNEGELYIGATGLFYIASGEYNFGSGSTSTSRKKVDYGVLSISNLASFNGYYESNFVDGYAQIESNSAFIVPLGHAGVYAPIQLTPSTLEAVAAAYLGITPATISNVFDPTIASLSLVEYWHIRCSEARAVLSLSWRASSAISDLTSASLPNLTIVGWNGSSWVSIPSIVDDYSILGNKSSLVSGSIRTNVEVDLSQYSAFTFGELKKQWIVTKVQLTVYIDKNRLFIEASLPITAVSIYDILGKKIVSEHLKGVFKYDKPFDHADEVYIVIIELDNGVSIV